MKKINLIILLLFFCIKSQLYASCGEDFDKSNLISVNIYSGYIQANKDYFASINSIRESADTITKSDNSSYTNSLYEFLCNREFKKIDVPVDCHANYIVIDFVDAFSDEWVTFSTDGEYLYTNDGYSGEVNKEFRLKFHFSDNDLKAYLTRREQKDHPCTVRTSNRGTE